MIPAGANRPTAVAASRKSNGLLAASAALITSILIAASMPLIAAPTMLPTAPMANEKTIDTMPTRTAAIAFARMTCPRCGTSVNVISPVRWLH